MACQWGGWSELLANWELSICRNFNPGPLFKVIFGAWVWFWWVELRFLSQRPISTWGQLWRIPKHTSSGYGKDLQTPGPPWSCTKTMTSRLIQFVTFVSPIWSTHDSTLLISGSRFPHHPQKKGHENLQTGQVTISFQVEICSPPKKKNYPQENNDPRPKICWRWFNQSDPTWSHRVEVTFSPFKGSRFPHHRKVTSRILRQGSISESSQKKTTWTPTKSIAGKCVPDGIEYKTCVFRDANS